VRLCETLLASHPELGNDLLRRVEDDEAQVRLQLAYTLGQWSDPRAGRALGQLLVHDGSDRFFLVAAMSSVHKDNLDAVLLAVIASPTPAPSLVDSLLRLASALGQDRATGTLLRAVSKTHDGHYAAWQFTALASLLDSLELRKHTLVDLSAQIDPALQAAVRDLGPLFDAARKLATDSQAGVHDRGEALRLLGRGLDHQDDDASLLANLLAPQIPEELQATAIAAMGHLRGPHVPELLLAGWKGYGPGLRGQALEVLLRREEWVKTLLDALEHKQIPAAEIDAPRRQHLLQYRESGLRRRAAQLFAGAVDTDRQKVIDTYQSVSSLKGDSTRGQADFTKTCSSCHRLANIGHEVGPDLSALADRSTDYLLTAILDPNRAVEARYINYVAETKNGLVFTGVLVSESGTSITLLGPNGKPQVVLRKDLESLTSTGKSAMPEGLEKDVRPQDMADLLFYLRAIAPRSRKQFEGNTPELVQVSPDGALRLYAKYAEIYGKSLVLEPTYGNLGFWHNEDDHAIWTVRVPRAGRYAVWFDCACDADNSGNTYVLEADDESLTGTVASTGGWETYRQARVGELTLRAGHRRIVIRPAGKLRGYLIDLKGIRLVPVAP
jgi:putative heme-binding domain-containing protein